MSSPPLLTPLELQVRRVYPVSRERLFRAWTDPRELKAWFGVADGYTTPIAEIDLRVGGRYRLGMQPPGANEILIVGGEYREIIRPERIVFTWKWESSTPEESPTLVTVEFLARGDSTEMVLRHEGFADSVSRSEHQNGWEGCIGQLTRMLTEKRE